MKSTTFEFEIKICLDNREDINSAICKIQEGINFGTISVDTIFESVLEFESRFPISKSNLLSKCVVVDYNASDILAKRNNAPFSTQFTMQNKEDGWYLVNIKRETITNKRFDPDLSEKAIHELLERWSR